MSTAASFALGALFALGLALGGMTDPARVVGFLDFLGAWDPTLAFVMAGAVGTYLLGFRLVRRRSAPLLEARFALPADAPLDRRTLAGATIFGVGWGLAGYCPGPALVAAGAGRLDALIFVPAMLLGIAVARAATAPVPEPRFSRSPSS